MNRFVIKILIISMAIMGLVRQAEAQNAPVTWMSRAGNLVPGQQVVVPVTVSGFKDIGSVSLTCDYDSSLVEFVSCEINPLLGGAGIAAVGDNPAENGIHRLIFGWFGNNLSLPDSTWILKYKFIYNTGIATLHWFDDGPSCTYTDKKGFFLKDTPSSTFYIDGHICGAIEDPGQIDGLDSVGQGTKNIGYRIKPLQNATDYTWTFPPGAYIENGADSNCVSISFLPSARSGFVTVSGVNNCGTGPGSTLPVTVYDTASILKPGRGKTGPDDGFLIFPNPATDFFFLKCPDNFDGPLNMSVFSSSGEILEKLIIKEKNQDNEYRIEVPGLLSGAYFILLRSGQILVLKKLIIKRI